MCNRAHDWTVRQASVGVQASLRGVGGVELGHSHQSHNVPTLWVLQLSPLILQPGPIYAVDGDRGINQRIIYSFLGGEWGPPPASLSIQPGPHPHPHPGGHAMWTKPVGTSGLRRGQD